MSKIKHLNEFTEEAVDSPLVVEGKPVPNKFPTLSNFPYRIALIGEAPGKDEVAQGEPFVGMSGKLLSALLGKANIVREACFIGNICQHRPPNNDIEAFAEHGPEMTAGLRQLKIDLDKYNPNLCVLLGKTALRAGNGSTAIGDYRGSLFIGDQTVFDEAEEPLMDRKCMASWHPAYCLRQYECTTVLAFDLKRAYKEGQSSTIKLPQRTLVTDFTPEQIIRRCECIRRQRLPIACDIEGYVGDMSCISIATSASFSFTIPFSKRDRSSYYENAESEVRVWAALSGLLGDPAVPKILQNSLYDRFVLQYSYGIIIQNVVDDTMVKFHEAYAELEKSLGFQASILTDQPYYKSDRKSDNQATFYRYCAMDSAVTFEINQRLEGILDDRQKEHYRFNVAMETPFLFMELHGILYDTKLAKERLKEVNSAIYKLQYDLDKLSGFGLDEKMPRVELERQVRAKCCYVRDSSIPKKAFAAEFDKIIKTIRTGELNKEQVGYLNTAIRFSMNVEGNCLPNYLYKTLKLPVFRYTDTGQPSVDGLSLLKLTKKTDHPAIRLIIEIVSLRTRSEMLAIHADPDGRIRCGYNVVGAATGRISCYTSPTGSGYNLQTIPDEDHIYPVDHPLRHGMRDLFPADPGHEMGQLDLKGSDGWTIGANLNALGDSTMLDDLRFGIKPASRICYMLRHGNNSLVGKTRTEVKELLKEVKKEDWDYFACKVGIWGICYLMGPDLLSDQILEESNGKIAMSRADVKQFHAAVHNGYKVRLWHDAMARRLAKRPVIESDGGFRRRFYGRRDEVLGKALAHEPQYYTTRATNLAAYRLWTDPENRLGGGTNPRDVRFRVTPLHQVHDALLLQWKIEDTAWAFGKVKSWFDNPLMIAGQRIVIPFDGRYGRSWGELTNEIV